SEASPESLGASALALACPFEDHDATVTSGYRSSPEHRSRAPIFASRTKPHAPHGAPLPVVRTLESLRSSAAPRSYKLRSGGRPSPSGYVAPVCPPRGE